MALKLYRRHRKECEAGHPEDSKSGEFEEGRRGWKRCGCPIHASGNIRGKLDAAMSQRRQGLGKSLAGDQLGRFELALNVADLNASLTFYSRLGFTQIDGSEHSGVAVIRSGNCRIALYQGHIAENLINFRGGDISAIDQQARAEGLTFEKEPFSAPPTAAWAPFCVIPTEMRSISFPIPVRR
jgi:lactoylglutathione lyase